MTFYTVRVLNADAELVEQNTFDNITDAEEEYIDCERFYRNEMSPASVQLFNTASGSMILETYCG